MTSNRNQKTKSKYMAELSHAEIDRPEFCPICGKRYITRFEDHQKKAMTYKHPPRWPTRHSTYCDLPFPTKKPAQHEP